MPAPRRTSVIQGALMSSIALGFFIDKAFQNRETGGLRGNSFTEYAWWEETSGHKSVQYAVGTRPSQEAGINRTLRNRAGSQPTISFCAQTREAFARMTTSTRGSTHFGQPPRSGSGVSSNVAVPIQLTSYCYCLEWLAGICGDAGPHSKSRQLINA